jgi:hypothetical protein
MLLRLCSIVAAIVLAAAGLKAQSDPLIAKMRLTVEVSVEGRIQQTHTQEGLFYRASTGSEIQEWTVRDGKDTVGNMRWAGLTDREHDAFYKVDYQNHRAYQQSFAVSALQAPDNGPPPKGLTQQSVEGIPCSKYPARLVVPGKAPVEIGYSCRAESYDSLELKRETTVESGGKTMHTTFELYNIQTGVEPDPKLFDLTSFTIYRPDEKKIRHC